MSASIRSLLAQNNGKIRLLEAHDRNSRETIRKVVGNDGQSFQGVWISGLTQTTYLGVPDTELISPLKRASLMTGVNDNPQQNDCRPLCAAYDADSGGNVADIPALVTLLASMGVSMIVIEDKSVCEPGKKVNSLKETSCLQGQANLYEFAKTIRAFTSASAHTDMMIAARIESFTVRIAKKDEADEKASIQGALRDALTRAEVYRNAGADAVMIHSKSALPDEVLSFLTEYRSKDSVTPLVVVPTTYSQTTENALYHAGANVIIYANHLMRAKIYAIGEFSKQFLVEKPDFFSQDTELSACLRARNFGCLLQKLLTKDLGEEAKQYRVVAENHAAENMNAVVKCLLDGKMSSAADARIISVKELLKINAHQISVVEKVIE
jgi:phosphoenolpyruvate phosphomutase